MYIEPTSSIILCRGIGWTNNYQDTPYYETKTEQYNSISNRKKVVFERQSYQRHSKNTLRILSRADDLFDCNYLMFQNSRYGSKWFYAFITNCEYINDNTAEITYEIDEIQTWFWDLTLGMCFVEREIPETDNLYENLVPENLETGDYIEQNHETLSLNNKVLVIYSTAFIPDENGEWQPTRDCYIGGVPVPLYLEEFLPSNEGYDYYNLNGTSLRDRIEDYIADDEHPDNICFITIMPMECFDQSYDVRAGQYIQGKTFELEPPNQLFQDYVPKNKKLYTFPYRFLRVSNNSGQVNIYKYEMFDNAASNSLFMKYTASMSGNGAVFLYPINYASIEENYDEGITLTNFPTVPWSNDAYQAYLAQNKASISTSILSSTITGLIGLVSAGAAVATAGASVPIGISLAGAIGGAGTALSAGANIAQTLGKVQDAQSIPNSVRGQSQADGLNLGMERLQFDFYQMCIRKEFAKIIDDYFSLYGYAQHKVKIPNIKSRPNWNYTQTKGCILKGNCPADTKAFISSCFDRGIRFWKNSGRIGDYEMNNLP